MNIPGARPAAAVVGSARAVDGARAAGLPDELVVVLLAARRAWWSEGTGHEPWAPWPTREELAVAAGHPASRVLDELLVAEIRRRLRR